MKDEKWYQSKDLIGVKGLPSTPQGIIYKAKLNGWKRRRVSGVKGNVYEYSPPSDVIALIEEAGVKQRAPRNAHDSESEHNKKRWLDVYDNLTETEQSQILYQIQRQGINSLFQASKTNELFDHSSRFALKMAELILALPEQVQNAIFTQIELQKESHQHKE